MDFHIHIRRGYPDFCGAVQEDLVLQAFIQALTPGQLCQHIQLQATAMFAVALKEAVSATEILSPSATSSRSLAPPCKKLHLRAQGPR